MKVNSPMLKSVFSFSSKILLVLSLAGCSKTLTNVTPDDAQRNPSNLYRFTTQCNIRMNKVIPETLKLSLVIDGEKFPLKAYDLTPSFYYYDHFLDATRTDAKYFFEACYVINNCGKKIERCDKTPLAKFKIREHFCSCLGGERAPISAEVKVLGQGFTAGDLVQVGEYNAVTHFISENVISFQVPNVETGKFYPVYFVSNGEKNFIGNLLIDQGLLSVDTDSIELNTGDKEEIVILSSMKAGNGGLYVNVTTDIPNSVIMPEVVIPEGEDSVAVEIEGGDAGEGHLYISAKGFNEIELPIVVQGDEEEEDNDSNSEA